MLYAAALAGWQATPLAIAGSPGAAGAAGASPSDPAALDAWLRRIKAAASEQSFQGTYVVSAAGVVWSARISHYCVGGSQYEHIETLDGQARHVYRHDEQVVTVWPASRLVSVEERGRIAAFPAIAQGGASPAAANYEITPEGTGRVAGREVAVLLLRPRDKLRFAQRLCADRATGLLLRHEILGERSEVLEASAFSDLSIGIKPRPQLVLAQMKRIDGYRVVRPAITPLRLEDAGWALRPGIPGFELVSSVRRPLAADAADDRESAIEVLQAVFSDGLTNVSVFIEPFDAARHRAAMLTASGATHTLTQRQGSSWITVVGDVPASTLQQFAASLAHRKP